MRALVTIFLFVIRVSGQSFDPVAHERAPESILQLPEGVRHDLAGRHCVVPQYVGPIGAKDSGYMNGHLKSRSSIEYAVVCHIPDQKIQHVLVYARSEDAWTGEVIDRATFDPSLGGDKCWVTVDVATPKYIRDHVRAYTAEKLKRLPRLDHNGVNVGICEKASVVHYFARGKWQQFQGAD